MREIEQPVGRAALTGAVRPASASRCKLIAFPRHGGRHLWAHRVARRFIVAASERIFAHGQAATTLVQRELGVPARKLVTIPHGHWADRYPPAPARIDARRQLCLRTTSFVYGFVGGCEPYKGLENLIRAFSEIPGEPVLAIAGRFRSEAYLRTIAHLLALLPAERVLFAPRHLEDEEIPVYLAAVDVLVTPFEEILTSGSVMLGLSFGRPVIAPRAGGVVDMMDHRHGILYDPGSPSALPRAMEDIRAMSFDAAALVEHARGFSWSDAASAVMAAVEGQPR